MITEKKALSLRNKISRGSLLSSKEQMQLDKWDAKQRQEETKNIGLPQQASSPETIIQNLRINKKKLFKKYGIKRLAIFGSISRGDYKTDSDVDILVEFKKTIGIEFIDLAFELEELLNRSVDLISKKGIKPKYFAAIKSDLKYV